MTEMAQVKVEGQTVEVLSESGGPPCARPLAAPKHPIMRVRVMATYMVLLLRLVLPALVAACRALLRNQRCVRERVVPAVFAFIANSISLSSLSGKPSSEESLLGPEASPGAAEAAAAAVEPVLERSVTCNVLFDPGDAARRADVIFIHGLHGSLEKTWRQGSWREGPAIQPLPLRRSPPTPPPELLDAVFSSAPEQLCQQDEDEEEEEEAGRPPPPPRAPTPPHSAARPPAELYSDCWPRDWLPQDCPGLRVIALNYTTDPFLWRPLWMSKRHRYGSKFVDAAIGQLFGAPLDHRNICKPTNRQCFLYKELINLIQKHL
ncbi:Protein SERAC1 [Gryllus bimaculatus]|nr:Protein SERAC1 [Gryllus bimaculatus]